MRSLFNNYNGDETGVGIGGSIGSGVGSSSDDVRNDLENLKQNTYYQMATMRNSVTEIESKVNEYNETQKKIENEQKYLRQDRIRNIEVLGIFVTLFTFISVEIAILESVTSIYELLAISIVFFGGLCLFLSVLMHVAEFWIRGANEFKLFKNNLIYASLILTCIGIAVGFYSMKYYTPPTTEIPPTNQVLENTNNTVAPNTSTSSSLGNQNSSNIIP